MQPRLLVKVLPRESRVVLEGNAIPIRVFLRQALAEGVGVPFPDRSVLLVEDRPRRVQVVGMHIVGLVLPLGILLQHRNRGVFQPHRLLPQGVVLVIFADEMALAVVHKAVGAIDEIRPALEDALAQGVVVVLVGLAASHHLGQPAGGIEGEGRGAVAGRIAGGVVGVGFADRAGDRLQAVAGGRIGVGIGIAARLAAQPVAVQVIRPQAGADGVHFLVDAVDGIVAKGVVKRGIGGVIEVRDAGGGVEGQAAGDGADGILANAAVGVDLPGVEGNSDVHYLFRSFIALSMMPLKIHARSNLKIKRFAKYHAATPKMTYLNTSEEPIVAAIRISINISVPIMAKANFRNPLAKLDAPHRR